MKLILVRGLPGSGKTTFVEGMFPDTLHLEADMLCVSDGVYSFRADRASFRHEILRMMVNYALGEGADVVVSNTLTTLAELAPYLTMAAMFGATVAVYRMQGTYPTRHHVPEAVLQSMRNRWQDKEGEIIVPVDWRETW